MAASEKAPELSPVNIEQNRRVGIDSPVEGSRMGREANKGTGDPGERGRDPVAAPTPSHPPREEKSSPGTGR